MKSFFTLFIFSGISLLAISSCRTLFDVYPKQIVTPFVFDNSSIQVSHGVEKSAYSSLFGSTASVFTDVSVVQFTLSEEFTEAKPGLTYGAYVYYDSLSALTTIKTGQVFGIPDYFPVDTTGRGGNRTVNIRIEPFKGLFQYIVLAGIDSAKTTNSVANSRVRNYFSQGFIKVKINPWSRMANLDYYSPQQYKVKLFEANGKIGVIKYDLTQLFIYTYESNGWVLKANYPNKVACTSCRGVYDGGWVMNVESVYYVGNQYHFLVSTHSFNLSAPFSYAYGEVVTDQQFGNMSYLQTADSGANTEYYGSAVDKDTLRVLYKKTYPWSSVSRQRANNDFTDYDMATSYAYSLSTKKTTDFLLSDVIKTPTIAAFIGPKLIVNTKENPAELKLYELSNGKYVVKGQTTIPSEFTNLLGSRLVTFAGSQRAFLLMGNQSICQLSVNNANLVFTKFYSAWLPGNSLTAIVPGVLYNSQLVCLVNDYEVWMFDPDFGLNTISSRLPNNTVTIVPL